MISKKNLLIDKKAKGIKACGMDQAECYLYIWDVNIYGI